MATISNFRKARWISSYLDHSFPVVTRCIARCNHYSSWKHGVVDYIKVNLPEMITTDIEYMGWMPRKHIFIEVLVQRPRIVEVPPIQSLKSPCPWSFPWISTNYGVLLSCYL
jgi:hypothetical protein